MGEGILYEDERVQVTPALVRVDGVNYASAGIRGVRLYESPPDRQKGLALIVAGGVCLLIAAVPLSIMLATLSDKTSFSTFLLELIFISLTALLGLVLLFSAFRTLRDRRARYTLKLETSKGEVAALSSRDHEYMEKITAAIRLVTLK